MPTTISDLPQVNAVSNSDLLIVETNPNSTPNTKTITVANFKTSIGSIIPYAPELVPSESSSPTGLPIGTTFHDGVYLYVVLDTELVGRVILDIWTNK